MTQYIPPQPGDEEADEPIVQPYLVPTWLMFAAFLTLFMVLMVASVCLTDFCS